jgi:hypothetical protein
MLIGEVSELNLVTLDTRRRCLECLAEFRAEWLKLRMLGTTTAIKLPCI